MEKKKGFNFGYSFTFSGWGINVDGSRTGEGTNIARLCFMDYY